MIMIFVEDIPMSGDSNESPDLVVKYFRGPVEVRIDPKSKKFLGLSVKNSGDTFELYNAPIIR